MDEYLNSVGQKIGLEVLKALQSENKELVVAIIPQQWTIYLEFDEKQVTEAYKTKYIKNPEGNLRVAPDAWHQDRTLYKKVDMMVKKRIIIGLENGEGGYLDDDPRIKRLPRWRPDLPKGY
jgi:hypothetical protein